MKFTRTRASVFAVALAAGAVPAALAITQGPALASTDNAAQFCQDLGAPQAGEQGECVTYFNNNSSADTAEFCQGLSRYFDFPQGQCVKYFNQFKH